MLLESAVLSTEPFAARCYRPSQAIHWLTVAIRLHASLGAALAAVILIHIFVAIGHSCSLGRASRP